MKNRGEKLDEEDHETNPTQLDQTVHVVLKV